MGEVMPKVGKTTRSEQVYEAIKRKIIANEFEPGDLLQERSLAEMLQVSRTPVREAVIRLAQEGWLDLTSQKSIRVREVTLRKVREIFEIRGFIEDYTIEQIFARNLNRKLAGEMDADLRQIKENLGNQQEIANHSFDFHSHFVGILGNLTLNAIWEKIIEEIVRIGILGIMNTYDPRFEEFLDEHERLVNSLWAGEKEQVRNSLQKIKAEVFRSMERKLQKD
jgi:DNA-binding GntR family transcriptional regulator